MEFQDMEALNQISETNANLYYDNFRLQSLKKYLDQAELLNVKKGELFFPGKNFFGFIILGKFQRTLVNSNGTEKIIRILNEGNLIGEISYFISRIPLDGILALTDGEIRIFKRDFIENTLLKDDMVVHEIIQWLCIHVASMSVQIEESLNHDLRTKIGRFLYNFIKDFGDENADGTLEYMEVLSQNDIARYLGLNRVCVNRVCTALIKERKIERKSKGWKIIDKDFFEDL